MEKEYGYIAGKLFSDSSIRQRLYEGKILKEQTNVEWYNPIEAPFNDKSKLPLANDIFQGDIKQVLKSKYIIAELDDEDAGTISEISICWAINYMLNFLDNFKGTGCSYDSVVDAIKMQIPKKELFVHCSDIRLSTGGQYENYYLPIGLNQFVVGMTEQIGKIYPHFEDIIEVLRKNDKEQNNK